ncbi:glycosyl hydrolase family 65 protein [Spirochaeta africana]|uniref:Trehalose/maltose hydrolase or phosphorylase n=1 Tax=Spirochaeta africana (strain ATCC 700263 / DSM 8902 / Z-7692) TaxID=889378 RepID=H9UID1_SPIAZ|nr:glycosyl hydrolase family 65 protein [Spirochaeta africana]AFG37274.1 trehalose/maltose hydrolase or phosphorylase [Spirochaeta africana DSM 8902]
MKKTSISYDPGGWIIRETGYTPDDTVSIGSNFMVGNGYLGYRGTPLEWGREQYAACVVTDTYDMADGKWRELCTVPNALSGRLVIDGAALEAAGADTVFGLDLAEGRFFRTQETAALTVAEELVADQVDLHLVARRVVLTAVRPASITLQAGIDSDIWSLNGNHFSRQQWAVEALPQADHASGLLRCDLQTGESRIDISVGHAARILLNGQPVTNESVDITNESWHGIGQDFSLAAGDRLELELYMAVYSSEDGIDPVAGVRTSIQRAVSSGWSQLMHESRERWQQFWEATDIRIEGDHEAQVTTRFNIYHNVIAAPRHSDRLPIGARGLSCQAYQGAAFWDQEIFNMPMFLYTDPGVARNILAYRYHTLPGARRKAQRLGYRGAFYAWISGKTGDELCPDYFFVDVLTGRRIRNHFNDWQIHISPDIAYAIWEYLEATGDWEFVEQMGAEVLFEIARFCFSHLYFKKDKDRYETIRLLGPDEYHENVDNNAFTNYQIQFACRAAVAVYERLQRDNPDRLQEIVRQIGLEPAETDDWRDVVDRIYLPQPTLAGQLIEQFDGYFQLEDVFPQEVAARLKDPGEYWGWPNGVAVATQVLKQADVIQLFVQHDAFPIEVQKANYEYYAPRTQHGSSLSPSSYAIIAARVHNRQQAYDFFMKSNTVDLYNTNKAVSGGTFIGGIHTAACGASWKVLFNGFVGFEIENSCMRFRPRLPDQWKSITVPFVFRGQPYRVTVTAGDVLLEFGGDPQHITDLPKVLIGDTEYTMQESLRVPFASGGKDD